MNTRRDTLDDRVARAQREIGGWDARFVASMQLQGGATAIATAQSSLSHSADALHLSGTEQQLTTEPNRKG